MSEFKKRESQKSPDYYYPPTKNGANPGPTTNGKAPAKANGLPTGSKAGLNGGAQKSGNGAAANGTSGKNPYPYAQNANPGRVERERSYANEDDLDKSAGRRTPRPASRNNSNIRQMSPDTLEIERLKAQINQEEQLRQAVEQSYNELLSTSKELEKRMNMIDEESNEWKTRFENQEEINRQLSKQIGLLDTKLDSTKQKAKTTKSRGNIDRNEASPEHLAELQKTKQSLIAQLRDYEWRLEQENKAYHKANEERKELHQEILDIRNQLTAIKENNAHHQHPLTSRLGAHKPIPPIYTSLSNPKLDAADNDYNEAGSHFNGNANSHHLSPNTRYPNNYYPPQDRYNQPQLRVNNQPVDGRSKPRRRSKDFSSLRRNSKSLPKISFNT